MCSNYVAVTSADRLLTYFGVSKGDLNLAVEAYPMGSIPIIRLAREGELLAGEQVLSAAVWRFTPPYLATIGPANKGWDEGEKPADPPWARNTFNARSEEVAGKKTFAKAWRDGQRCILPTELFFEPRYYGTVEDPGKSERWRIQQVGGVPMGIAGIYRFATHPETGVIELAAAMLTINADGHPVMSMFHRPGDEKRMPVILDPDDYARWLSCTPAEAQTMCRVWGGQLEAFMDLRPGQAAVPRSLF